MRKLVFLGLTGGGLEHLEELLVGVRGVGVVGRLGSGLEILDTNSIV